MRIINNLLISILFLLLHINLYGDNWTQKANIPSIGRCASFSFSLGGKGYVGGGQVSQFVYRQDFWCYDPVINTWTQIANFGGGPRGYGISFNLGGKGYAGFGVVNGSIFDDLWEYDPILNSWQQKNPILGILGYFGSTGFSIGNNSGYLCGGFDNNASISNNLWQFDLFNNSWGSSPSLPLTASRVYGVSFVVGTNVYVGLGSSSSSLLQDFWKYNSLTNSWSQVSNFPDTLRTGATSFSLYDKGYVGFGYNNQFGLYMFNLWQYDTLNNQWTKKMYCPGSGREFASSFVLNNKAYISFGNNQNNAFNDLWEYTPDISGIDEIKSGLLEFTLYPNPATNFIIIGGKGEEIMTSELTIVSLTGETVKYIPSFCLIGNRVIGISNLVNGSYIIKIHSGNKYGYKKFIKY